MTITPIPESKLKKYLSVLDHTKDGSTHAINKVYRKIVDRIRDTNPDSEILVWRQDPIVTIEDNYDNLLIPADNIGRSSTYTHYVDNDRLLRTQTSAGIPPAMRSLSNRTDWDDVIIIVPGLKYRRDVSDRTHVGQIQAMDIWRIVRTESRPQVTQDTLTDAVRYIADAAAPGWSLRIIDSPHPYTNGGREVNAVHPGGRDIEILECGLIKEEVLAKNGLDPEVYSGWALGMGLDRLVMTLKNIPDIRYLRSDNPRISKQMHDLKAYREVSLMPPIHRDISYSVPITYVEEDISQAIMTALGDKRPILEQVDVLSETAYEDLPKVAIKNLGMNADQKNVLVRITLRDLEKTLTKTQANQIYDQLYPTLHHGTSGYK